MNSVHLLIATLALLLAQVLKEVEASPTISSIEPFDDVDMSLLRRAMRQQGNDCDTHVSLKNSFTSVRMCLIHCIVTCAGRSSGTLPTMCQSYSLYCSLPALLPASREPPNMVYEVLGVRNQQMTPNHYPTACRNIPVTSHRRRYKTNDLSR